MRHTLKYVLMSIGVTLLAFVTTFCFVSFLVMVSDKNYIENAVVALLITTIFLVPTVALAIERKKLKEIIAQEQGFINSKEKKLRKTKYRLTHILGLPFIKGARCTLISKRDKISITAQGTVITLNKSKITNVSCETNVEKYAQAVSSVGGTIGGGMIGGAIGAAIGGRVKSEEFEFVRSYLVITYVSEDDTVKYILFDYDPKAANLIRDFQLFNKANMKKQVIDMK